MKKILFLLLFLPFLLAAQPSNTSPIEAYIKPCPNAPNCVSTIAIQKRKKMQVIDYQFDTQSAKDLIKLVVKGFKGATLEKEATNYLHFTFVTKIGNFTDDVVFYFDEEQKQIHFRSASREGYSDMGANKRRMKHIIKHYEKFIAEN